MDKKTNFSSDELLEKRFSAVKNGYDPLEVDKTIDKIIEDYRLFEKMSSVNLIDIEKTLKELEELKKQNAQLKSDLDKEKNKWKYISKDHKDIRIDNYELLLRIGKLEMLIHEKLNINPDDIK